MFKEFADEKHKEQAEEFLISLGKFTIAFESVCAAMRYLIMFILRSQGLKNQDMEQVIIGDRRARDLRELLGALYVELPRQGENDREKVRELLKSIEDLTTKRNTPVHGNWCLGTEAIQEEFWTATLRFRKNPTKGAVIDESWASASYVNELIQEAKRVQVLLQRLQYCICQSGFKVAAEFNKPL